MSSKNDDPEPGLQQGLQPAAPLGTSGPPDGQGPEALPAPKNAQTAPSGPPVPANAAALQAIGEPDAQATTQWCAKCQADVIPRGKGVCPRCGRILRLNFLARRHPVNKLRKQQLFDQLIADYQPQTTLAQASCEHLAGVLEQLEALKAGSQEHKRLVELAQLLGTALEASRTQDARSSDADPASITPDAMIERTTAILRGLLQLHDEQERSRAHIDAIPRETSAGAEAELLVKAEPTAPAPERCLYCHQAPCVGASHHAFEVLHWNDPAEIEKRAAQATAEMFESLRRQRHGDPNVR
jgi:hypothetical protein